MLDALTAGERPTDMPPDGALGGAPAALAMIDISDTAADLAWKSTVGTTNVSKHNCLKVHPPHCCRDYVSYPVQCPPKCLLGVPPGAIPENLIGRDGGNATSSAVVLIYRKGS